MRNKIFFPTHPGNGIEIVKGRVWLHFPNDLPGVPCRDSSYMNQQKMLCDEGGRWHRLDTGPEAEAAMRLVSPITVFPLASVLAFIYSALVGYCARSQRLHSGRAR